MRLCKGDFVEVLNKKEVPTGSWHCAEVISGNGHTYTVKYVRFHWTNEVDEPLTVRVPRKLLRPSPPPVVGADNWVSGDHVEVYHNMSWKTATVVKYLDQHIFLVRLLGESWEFEVHRSYIRVRQSWEHGKWFIVGKGACATSMKNYINTNNQPSIRKLLKRVSPVSLTNLEADSNSSQSTGVKETDRSQKKLKQGIPEHQSLSSGKVVDYVYPQEKLGGDFLHPMLDVAKNSFSANNLDMIDSNQFNHRFTYASRRFGSNSGASSVDSCSVDDTIRNKHGNGNHEKLCSDAESFGRWGNDVGACYSEKNVGLFEHKLDLILYRSALKVLFASGPLSWEDELKLVDLMDALHISNDEHLVEIKNLISTDANIPAF